MAQALNRSIDRVRAALVRNDEMELTDGQLLGHFVAVRDGDSFAALVRRHGPMVLGVCRRIIGDAHEAEDAFQATFLVLARRAGAIVPRERVGGWLYGVAVRTAREARSMRLRRTAKVSTQADIPEPAAKSGDPDATELRSLLDRELERLPEHYRLPVVLCELEGRSREEVGRQLRIPQGTLSSRLAKARRLLARRLKQRGLALPSGALALSMAADAVAACPPELIGSTVRAALPYAAGQAAGLSPSVAALCQGISKMLFIARLKGVAQGILLALLIAGLGGALLALGAQEQLTAPKPQKELTETSKGPAKPAEPSNSPLQFSEPKEVVLSMDSLKFMLDLDTGRTMGAPARILPEQQAMDVHPIQWQPYEQPEALQGLSLRGLPVKPNDWESSVADFQKALANRPLKPLTEMKYDPSERATFFFRTRDGKDGILQLLESTKDPKGIRLRYKVLDTKKVPAKVKEGRIAVCIGVWRQNGIGMDDGRLQLLSPDGKETAWLLEGVKHAERPGCRIVALSPDGTQVAYGVPTTPESNGAQGPLTIHIKSVADKKPGRSLKVEAFCWAWSPDGKELAVSRFTPPPVAPRPVAPGQPASRARSWTYRRASRSP
jgi:RNA polymerase sigma factor (sigma-70 family)